MSTVPIFTIGYGSRTLDEVLDILKCHNIQYLVDVRSIPYSKYRPDFNKETLDANLRCQGIRYLFLGEVLGGRPKDPSCYIDGKVDYSRCSEMDWFKQGLNRLKNAWEKQLRVAVMCSEGKPEDCHRSKLIGQSLAKIGVELAHIDEKKEIQSQQQVISKLLGDSQPSLFDLTFTSRKRYCKRSDQNA